MRVSVGSPWRRTRGQQALHNGGHGPKIFAESAAWARNGHHPNRNAPDSDRRRTLSRSTCLSMIHYAAMAAMQEAPRNLSHYRQLGQREAWCAPPYVPDNSHGVCSRYARDEADTKKRQGRGLPALTWVPVICIDDSERHQRTAVATHIIIRPRT